MTDPTPSSAYAATDWTAYQSCRPAYPPSLRALILAYHTTHSSKPNVIPTGRLLDIGAGSGLASLPFLHDFPTIHLSDPSAANTATTLVADAIAAQRLSTQLERSTTTGEDAHRSLPHASADLILVATAAHFCRADALIASAAQLLRPGGTLAVYSYLWPRLAPLRLARAFTVAASKLVYLLRAGDGPLGAAARLATENLLAGDGGLDSVPLPAALFGARTRIAINASRREFLFDGFLAKYAGREGENIGDWPSRVDEGEEVRGYESGVDGEAEGWCTEMDLDFLVGFFKSLRPAGEAVSDAQFEALVMEFAGVYGEEVGKGSCEARWPFKLVLGSRLVDDIMN